MQTLYFIHTVHPCVALKQFFFFFYYFIQTEPWIDSQPPLYSSYQTAHNPNEVHFSFGSFLTRFHHFSQPDDGLTPMIFHVARPWSCAKIIMKRWQLKQSDGTDGKTRLCRESVFSGLERWSDCPHKHGDQSIKNQPEMVWRGEEEEERWEEEDTW